MLKIGIHVEGTSKLTNEKSSSLHAALYRDHGLFRPTADYQSDSKADSKANSKPDSKVASRSSINIAQVFTHGPRIFKKNNIDVDAFNAAAKELGFEVYVHSCYSSTSIWKILDVLPIETKRKGSRSTKLTTIPGTSTTDAKTTTLAGKLSAAVANLSKAEIAEIDKQVDKLVDQLEAAAAINAKGLVLHVSKHKPEKIARVMEYIRERVTATGVKLLLEMVASKGDDKTYETPGKLNNLTSYINNNTPSTWPDWWGWCIDTAHIWGAGVDIRTAESMKEWIDAIDNKKKIRLIHLNGSSCARASGKDKHAIPFASDDKIWSSIEPVDSGAGAICAMAVDYSIPVVMEINRGTVEEAIYAVDQLTVNFN